MLGTAFTLGDLDVLRQKADASASSRLGYLPQDVRVLPAHESPARCCDHFAIASKALSTGEKAAVRRWWTSVAPSGEPDLRGGAQTATQAPSRAVCASDFGIAQALAWCTPRLIIVDEPTAGLDPEERNCASTTCSPSCRSEPDRVILSTHIVEDVAVLCDKFAVIRDGVLVARTTPDAARAALTGHVLEGAIERDQLARMEEHATILKAVFLENVNRVRVYTGDKGSLPGFEPVEPTLEDAYLTLMRTDDSPLALARPVASSVGVDA